MINTKLTLGTKLELELYEANGNKMVPTLVSQFEAVLPDDTMEILSPILEGRIFPVRRGTRMDVIYQKDGVVYKFAAEAIERKLEGDVHFLRIRPLTEEERIQRRYFFRFSCVRDIEYRIYACPEAKEDGEYRKGLTKDISGGGICFWSDVKPEIGWYVEGRLFLNREIPFVGRVIRVIDIREKGLYNYEIGIEYTDITNMDRERVIGFIYEEQRKLLKKGWTK